MLLFKCKSQEKIEWVNESHPLAQPKVKGWEISLLLLTLICFVGIML